MLILGFLSKPVQCMLISTNFTGRDRKDKNLNLSD